MGHALNTGEGGNLGSLDRELKSKKGGHTRGPGGHGFLLLRVKPLDGFQKAEMCMQMQTPYPQPILHPSSQVFLSSVYDFY